MVPAKRTSEKAGMKRKLNSRDQKSESADAAPGKRQRKIKVTTRGTQTTAEHELYHCKICLRIPDCATLISCGHLFCNRCIVEAVTKTGRCPICKALLPKKNRYRRIYI